MDECAGARRVSGLVTALEISLPSKSRRRVQRLDIKSRRGEISRKYGNYVFSSYWCSLYRRQRSVRNVAGVHVNSVWLAFVVKQHRSSI